MRSPRSRSIRLASRQTPRPGDSIVSVVICCRPDFFVSKQSDEYDFENDDDMAAGDLEDDDLDEDMAAADKKKADFSDDLMTQLRDAAEWFDHLDVARRGELDMAHFDELTKRLGLQGVLGDDEMRRQRYFADPVGSGRLRRGTFLGWFAALLEGKDDRN